MISKIATAFAIAIMCLACTTKESAAVQTSSPNETAVKLLELPDQEYFELGQPERSEINRSLIVLDGFDGPVIGMPSSIDIDARGEAPVLWATRASALRKWQVERKRNSIVIVSDLSQGEISLHNAFAGPKRIDYRRVPQSASGGPEAAARQKTNMTLGLDVLDLRSIASIPWSPRRLAVTMLIYDWKSNTETVTLEGGDAEQLEIAPRRRSPYVRPVSGAASPEAGLGAHVKIPATGHMDAPVPVSVSLQVPRDDVVTAPDADSDGASLVLGTLILFKLDALPDMPLHAAIAVPAKIVPDKDGTEFVEANFEFDVHDAITHKLSGTYQTYFAFGKLVLGPHPLNFNEK